MSSDLLESSVAAESDLETGSALLVERPEHTAPVRALVATYVRQGAVSSIGNILARLLGLLFSVEVARAYGPVGFGLVRYAIGVAALATVVAGPIPNAISRFVAVHRRNPLKVSTYFSNATLLTVLVLAASLAATAVYLRNSPQSVLVGALLVMCGTIVFNIYTELARGLGTILRMSLYYVVCNLGQLVVITAVIMGFHIHSVGVALAVYGLSMIVPVALFEVAAPRAARSPRLRLRLIRRDIIREVTAFSIPIVIAHASYTAWLTLDLVLVEFRLGPESAGVYSAAKTFVLAFTFVPYALVTVALRYFARGTPRDGKRSVVLSLATSTGSSLCLLAVISVAGQAFLGAVFGARYEAAAPSLLILSEGMTIYGLYLILEMWLVAKGYPWLHALAMSVTAVTSTLVEVILLPVGGTQGVAVGVMIGIVGGVLVAASSYAVVSSRFVRQSSERRSGRSRTHGRAASVGGSDTWEAPVARLLYYIKRWAWLVILCPLLAAAGAFGLGLASGTTYQAHVSLVFGQAGSSALSASTAAQLAGTYQGLLTSPNVMQNVETQLNLNMSPDALAARVHTSYELGSNVIQLQIDAPTTDEAIALANSVVSVTNTVIAQLPNTSLAPLFQVGQPTASLKAGSTRNVAIAAVVALLIALSVVGLWYYMDDTILQPSDLQGAVAVPLLSAPLKPSTRRTRSRRSRAAEAASLLFAALRRTLSSSAFPANLDKVRAAVVLYTWPTERESDARGVLELAKVASEAGLRALIINTDQHYPWPETLCQVPGESGFIDALSAGRPLAEVVHPLDLPGVAIVPAGHARGPSNPLLNAALLEHVLKANGPAVDLVLLTASPLLVDSTTATLATVADAVVVAAREKQSRKRDMRQALAVLGRVQADVLGTVMVPPSAGGRVGSGFRSNGHVLDPGVIPAPMQYQGSESR